LLARAAEEIASDPSVAVRLQPDELVAGIKHWWRAWSLANDILRQLSSLNEALVEIQVDFQLRASGDH